MPIQIASMLIPQGGQTYPVVEDTYFRGGMRVVSSYDDLFLMDPLSMKLGMLAVDASAEFSDAGGGIFQLTDLDLSNPEAPIITWTPLAQRSGFRGFWNPEDVYSAGDIVRYRVEFADFSVDAIFFAPENVPAGKDNPNSERGSLYWVRLWPQTDGPGGGSGGSYRGNYDPDEIYSAGDTVHNQLSIGGATSDAYWLCVQDNPGFEPNEAQDGTSWVLIGSSYNYPVGKTVNLVSALDLGGMFLPGCIVSTFAQDDNWAGDDSWEITAPRMWLCLQETDYGPSYSQNDTKSWVCLNRDNVKTYDFFIADASTANVLLDAKYLGGGYKPVRVKATLAETSTTRLTVEVVCRAGVLATVAFEPGDTVGSAQFTGSNTWDVPEYIGVRCASTDSTAKAIMLQVSLVWEAQT